MFVKTWRNFVLQCLKTCSTCCHEIRNKRLLEQWSLLLTEVDWQLKLSMAWPRSFYTGTSSLRQAIIFGIFSFVKTRSGVTQIYITKIAAKCILVVGVKWRFYATATNLEFSWSCTGFQKPPVCSWDHDICWLWVNHDWNCSFFGSPGEVDVSFCRNVQFWAVVNLNISSINTELNARF